MFHILILPYSPENKHPFFAHNAGQCPHNSGQNRHNAGKGCLFSGLYGILIKKKPLNTTLLLSLADPMPKVNDKYLSNLLKINNCY
jgi:hypothetical protein